MKRIAVIPGDGIGIEVTREATRVLECVGRLSGVELRLDPFDYGAERYLRTGETLPPGALERLRDYDAILLGALGDPRVPDMKHAADILLGLRFGLDLYVNYRPVRLLDERLCPLKHRKASEVDFVVFRENTEGLYVGMGGNFKRGTPDEVAIQEDINTRKGVERILRHAFEFARARGKTRLVMSDKSNVLIYGHDLWLRVFRQISGEYPGIEARHIYVDALAMQMIKDPSQFQVIVTCNMFGDILTDLGAQLQGGMGLAASANLHPEGSALFEPVHGSAPKYAGRNVANPFGAILTAALLLEHVGLLEQSVLVENAVTACIRSDKTTRDLGGRLGTREVGDAVCAEIESPAGMRG
ncbi:MAG TPA: 3-isopropylmalate dehydrogenase [Candidatus Polarisedimenticolia bacterium]|nr:3-isopropylmalate dehydrogenase [Candidatus Polarisedimenticolia bacterium]